MLPATPRLQLTSCCFSYFNSSGGELTGDDAERQFSGPHFGNNPLARQRSERGVNRLIHTVVGYMPPVDGRILHFINIINTSP